MKRTRPAPLFSFYGAKILTGRKYPAPIYGTIVEPFAGSAGYSRHYTTKTVILYERDPVIYAVLDYLTHAAPATILRLPLVEPPKTIEDFPHLTQAEKWTIGFWLNAGTTCPCKRLSSWGIRSGYISFWGVRCRARLAQTVSEIKHWHVRQGCWSDIDAQAHGDCTWFVDPPYQVQGKRYKYSQVDYEALGAWCQQLPGQVIVCESSEATWLPFHSFSRDIRLTSVNKKDKKFCEGIWCGGQGGLNNDPDNS